MLHFGKPHLFLLYFLGKDSGNFQNFSILCFKISHKFAFLYIVSENKFRKTDL